MLETRINTTHKIKATEEQIQKMISHYSGYLTFNTSNYIIARAKLPAATITFYKTNVVLFQGEQEAREYNYWAKQFNLPEEKIEENITNTYSQLSAIGSDEVGTGDYFGPIVVCATYVPNNLIDSLKKLGVKDSKLLTDKQMIPLAIKIAKLIPHSIMMLEPERINKLPAKYTNLNFLKAYLHNKVINSILKKIENVKYDAILIDEFTPKKNYLAYLENQKNVVKNVTLIPKGEKAHIAIAAASVLARVAFFREVKKISNEYGIEFLKGAGKEVDRTAILFVKNYGWDKLANVAKLKFANTERIKEYFLSNPLPKSKVGNLNNC